MEEAVPVAGGGQRKQLLTAGAHGGPPVQATCKHENKDVAKRSHREVQRVWPKTSKDGENAS